MLDNISIVFEGDVLMLFFKVIILVCVVLFTIFTIFLLNYVNSLQKIIAIRGLVGTSFIYFVALGYVIAAISLFVIALVIL